MHSYLLIALLFPSNKLKTSISVALNVHLYGFKCDLQIAAVGGNQRGRTFFKQHGWTELGSDKIEQKVSFGFHVWPSYLAFLLTDHHLTA
jgi:hypothetical protein